MSNLATKAEGAQVLSATTSDDRHPPANLIDGNDRTFWYSTGMYPQELVISFPREITPTSLTLISSHISSFTVLKCDKSEAKAWEEIWTQPNVGDVKKGKQKTVTEELNLKTGCRFLKLRIDAGHDEFCAVYELRVEGAE